MNKYTVMHTGKPFAGYIPAGAWHKLSDHKTLSAAVKRIKREWSHLPPNTWDDHYKILDGEGKRVDWMEYETRPNKWIIVKVEHD